MMGPCTSLGLALVVLGLAPDGAPIELDEVEAVGEIELDEVEAVEPAAEIELDEVETAEPPGDVDDVAPVEVAGSVEEVDDSASSGDPEPSGDSATPTSSDSPSALERLKTLTKHVRPGGFIQVDFLHRQISEDELSDGTREPLNETGFSLRNARFGFDADWRYVGTTAYVDLFSDGGWVRPATVDLHVQLPGKEGAPPLVQLRAGLLRVPFGFENDNQNDAQRFFGERTLVSHAYMPGLFDVGASLSGQLWALRWIVGVYNGQPVGAPGFGYRDPNAAKDFAGRLQLRGDAFRWLDAAIGLSGLWGKGFSAGTPATKDSFDWVDLNEDGRVTLAEIIPVTGSAGRPSENFSRWGLGADVQLRSQIPRIGQLMLYAEVAAGHNLDRGVAIADPVLLRRDQRGIGGYVGLTQQLTRHATIGVRYDEYLPDLDTLEPYEGTVVITRRRFQTVTAGVAAHLQQGEAMATRLLLEYAHQRNSLGRDAAGRPAQLDNDTLRVRAEVVF
ncbi:MAG: hypothetical protein AAF799_06985 [Myxococcota bacterium]